MIAMLGVFSIGFTGLRFWRVALDLVCRSRDLDLVCRSRDLDLVSSTLNLIVFFSQGVSSEGMSTIPCSSIADCRFFILWSWSLD
jgi:hypothetical protein